MRIKRLIIIEHRLTHPYTAFIHHFFVSSITKLAPFYNYKILMGNQVFPNVSYDRHSHRNRCITHTLAWSRKNRLVYNLHNKTIPNQSFGKCESSRTKSYHVCWRTALYRWTECSHHLIFNLELAGTYHNQLSYHALSTFRVCSHAWKSSNVTRPTQGRKYVKLHTRVVNRTTIWRIWWRERKRKQAYKRR